MEDRKTFVGPNDTRSFLAPAYRFLGRREAEASFAENKHWQRRDDRYNYFKAGNSVYQPRGFECLDTGSVDEDHRTREYGAWQFTTLRTAATNDMPRGATNTCLLVEGPRTYLRMFHRTAKYPASYYRFAEGDFPCYAVWGRDEAHPLGRPLLEEEDDGCRVFVGRSAFGAIYASTPRFRHDLSIEGFESKLALIKFELLDRDSCKDDVLRHSSFVFRQYGYNPNEPPQPYVLDAEKFNPIWQELADRAFDGFVATCKQMPTQLEQDIAYYLDQDRKSRAGSFEFRSRIEQVDWQTALLLAEEPWQLEVAVHAFDGPQFYEDSNYAGTMTSRVSRMIKRLSCSEERREQLRQMIDGFVAPRNRIWDYSGD